VQAGGTFWAFSSETQYGPKTARITFRCRNRFASEGHLGGGQIHDARIAALCLHHGVSVLWTADRDFSRFPDLKVFDPLVEPK
jgi:predicted nucleic acid-binding protein